MKPVYQVNRNGMEGDCFLACLASILNLPAGTVPDFGPSIGGEEYVWIAKANSWLAQFGLGLIATKLDQIDLPLPEALVIVVGKSSGGIPHSCVGRITRKGEIGWEISLVHDPFLPDEFIRQHRAALEADDWRWGLVNPPAEWDVYFLVETGYRIAQSKG